MPRVSQLMSWFLFSVAGVLLTVAMLAVPENAFADAGSVWCTSYCQGQCPGDPVCYGNCFGPCDAGYQYAYGNTDCTTYCGANYSGSQYTYCMAACGAQISCLDNTKNYCDSYKNESDCEVYNIYCPSDQKNCACRWRPNPYFNCLCSLIKL